MRQLAVLAVALLTSPTASAGNPYADFYFDQTQGTALDIEASDRDEVAVYSHGPDIDADIRRMTENGFAMLGYSSFNASDVRDKKAINHAEDVGAQLVLLASRHASTETAARHLFLPNTQTSSSRTNGTVSGTFGSGRYEEHTTTTTPGTTIIPFTTTITRYDFFASYWVKLKPARFGASVANLTAEQRAELQRNRGTSIKVVRNNSPAFLADFLPGDIILRVDGVDIVDSQDFIRTTSALAGREIQITLWRAGQTLDKTVQLNP